MRFSRQPSRCSRSRSAVLGLIALAAPLASASEPGPSQDVLDRIQRECLRAYPEDLLASMASGAKEIPDEVEADPQAQMQFLDKELHADKGLFYPILLEDILSAFERYVSPETRVLDLGSGDGRVLFLASLLGADATGIEYDELLVAVNHRALAALDDLVDAERIHVVQGDFFESSWSGYDVVYYFDLGSFEQQRLRKKMKRELDVGARLIVGFEQESFPGLEIETEFENIKVYRQPNATPVK